MITDPELVECVRLFRDIAIRLGIPADPLETLLIRAQDPEWRLRLYTLAFELHIHLLRSQHSDHA